MRKIITALSFLFTCFLGFAQQKSVRVLVLAENGGHHIAYTKAARLWLDSIAAKENFVIEYRSNTDGIDSAFLSGIQLFIQLDYPPYGWKEPAAKAFERYIGEGWGGWIGFHHATLLGEFDGFRMWNWFSAFMGDIKFMNYIPNFADGKVVVEKREHPVMQGLPPTFTIQKEEWYPYFSSPRPNVQVLASVDESTYRPATATKMGDHPVVWTNPKMKAKNVYIFMGHSPLLFDDKNYRHLFLNAIHWALAK